MPVPVRNLQSGPSVFSNPHTNVAIEWERVNHPNGEDIQYVPEDILALSTFQKAIQRGIFSLVEEESEASDAVDRQVNAFRERQDALITASQVSLDPTADNDILQIFCIGPNDRGNGPCRTSVAIREKQLNDKPPLCSLHENLAAQFIPTETGEVREGKPVITWIRSSVGSSL